MKKYFIIFLVLILSLIYFSKDMRKTLIVYTKGYSDSTALLESAVDEKIINMGKYRLITRDDMIFKEIQLQLQGVVEGKGDLKQLKADALIYIEVLDTFYQQQESYDKTSKWWEYEITAKYKLIDIQTGQVLENKLYKGTGQQNITKYKTSQEALRDAKYEAINDASSSIISKLNTLFILRGNILNQAPNGYLLVDLGRNHGVYKNMVFQFEKSYDVYGDSYKIKDGKLIVKDILDNKAFLKPVELPTKFKISEKGITVVENPSMSPERMRFNIHYTNLNTNYHGGGIDFALDNYEGFYSKFGLDFNIISKNIFYSNMNFALGYMIYAGPVEITPDVSFEFQGMLSSDASSMSFDIVPEVNMGLGITNNINLYLNSGYIFNIYSMEEMGLSLINGLRIKGGIEFKF
ncbi:hypothetical protein OSSY52_00200 [Tepiditoga spiralis]|uniref:Uncharacterized protein n=1 Tax=Tepiditoga spiralis TaxID=2108365 RepID=A0A7G1G989_9BACT|nr:hypothetical protein [Tepiditoga spiralis]BBE29879.1 hypothetical protein OSSY52_00200 [Tepiditoga spiralis]